MDLSLREQKWNKIIRLSNNMLDLSRREQWDELGSLEKKRGELLNEYFLKAVDESESERIAEGINEILMIDREIIKICQFQKDEFGEKLSQFNTSRRAKNAYRANSF